MSSKTEAPKCVNFKLDPEWYRVAQGLSIVLGYDSLDSYVSACIETNVRMYLMGGDDIDEAFRSSYKHLVHEYESEGSREQANEIIS